MEQVVYAVRQFAEACRNQARACLARNDARGARSWVQAASWALDIAFKLIHERRCRET